MRVLRKLKSLFLVLISVLLAGCASTPLISTGPATRSGGPCEVRDNIPRITPEELKKLMDEGADLVIVDTLYPYWYKKGHIKGAINFPWQETLREPIDLPRDKLLVLYCDCACEETSADVAEQLVKNWGYKNVKVLKGGWEEWVKLGYPTEKGEKKKK